MPNYFKIIDKDLIGRQDSMFDCYIYQPGKGWVWDDERILMDRIIGYDGEQLGNTDALSRLEQITEQEALKCIGL